MAGAAPEAGRTHILARKVEFENVGGEVFKVVEAASNQSVLWGELFKESERRFMRKELVEEVVTFSIKENYKIVTRSAWQPEVKNQQGLGAKPGRFVVLLHGLESSTASSWTWAKLARPLYQQGLSVVLLEFPGFGSSNRNMERSQIESWRRLDYQILSRVLSELGVQKFHLVACGESCAATLRMLQNAPHRLEKEEAPEVEVLVMKLVLEHIFHSPALDLLELFPESARLRSPRAEDWREQQRQGQLLELDRLLRRSGTRLLCTFDEALQPQAAETRVVLLQLKARSQTMNANLPVHDVTREDICDVQIGATVPLRFFFLSRAMKQRYVQWLGIVASASSPSGRGGGATSHEEVVAGSANLRAGARSMPALAATPAQPERPASQSGAARPQRLARGAGAGAGSLAMLSPLGDVASELAQQGERALHQHQQQQLEPLPHQQHDLTLAERKGLSRASSSATLKRSPSAQMSEAWWEASRALASDAAAIRRRTLSRLPADMQPPNLELLRPPLQPEPRLVPEEKATLEDGVDASLESYAQEAHWRKQWRPPGESLLAGLAGRPKSRDPEQRRTMWKTVNRAFTSAPDGSSLGRRLAFL